MLNFHVKENSSRYYKMRIHLEIMRLLLNKLYGDNSKTTHSINLLDESLQRWQDKQHRK